MGIWLGQLKSAQNQGKDKTWKLKIGSLLLCGFHYCATNLLGMSIANEMLNRSEILQLAVTKSWAGWQNELQFDFWQGLFRWI